MTKQSSGKQNTERLQLADYKKWNAKAASGSFAIG
jgi:hypothetical protein